MILLTFLLFTICNLFGTIASGSVYMIGTRLFNEGLPIDEKIVVDILKSEPSRILTNHTIKFEYAINGLISCIELSSESNVQAEIQLSYDDDKLLRGSATAINELQFQLKIIIYGFKSNQAPKNFKPLIGKDVVLLGEFESTLNENQPQYSDNYDYSEYNIEFDDYFKEIGSRGLNDILLYEEMKHSQSTKHAANHSIVFYYIDSTFITYVKVIGILTETPSIKYSHVSDNSIKTIVNDYNVFSLSAKFEVYGYNSDSIPSNFTSRLPGPHIKLNNLMDSVIKNFECVEKSNGNTFQCNENIFKFLIFSICSLIGLNMLQKNSLHKI